MFPNKKEHLLLPLSVQSTFVWTCMDKGLACELEKNGIFPQFFIFIKMSISASRKCSITADLSLKSKQKKSPKRPLSFSTATNQNLLITVRVFHLPWHTSAAFLSSAPLSTALPFFLPKAVAYTVFFHFLNIPLSWHIAQHDFSRQCLISAFFC